MLKYGRVSQMNLDEILTYFPQKIDSKSSRPNPGSYLRKLARKHAFGLLFLVCISIQSFQCTAVMELTKHMQKYRRVDQMNPDKILI